MDPTAVLHVIRITPVEEYKYPDSRLLIRVVLLAVIYYTIAVLTTMGGVSFMTHALARFASLFSSLNGLLEQHGISKVRVNRPHRMVIRRALKS
jgi:hypothetical protein